VHHKLNLESDILFFLNSLFFFALAKNLPTFLKSPIKQQLTIERKNEELNQIMNMLPEGVMLASINSRSDIKLQCQ